MKRPPSVWIAQTLVLFFGLVVIFGLLANIGAVIKQMTITSQTGALWGRLLSLLLGLLIAIMIVAVFWGLQKRKQYGRWGGILIIGLIFLVNAISPSSRLLYSALRNGLSTTESLPSPYYNFDNQPQLIGGIIANLTIQLLLLLLICRLAFAQKVRRFFAIPSNVPLVPTAQPDEIKQY